MEKHFVEFFRPGTFVAETSIREIDSWDVKKAFEMSKDIKERYNASPYGFRFITKSRKNDELDSKVTDSSKMYYIGCKVITKDDLDPVGDKILTSNMMCNGWDKMATTTTGWRWTQPLKEGDIVLDDNGNSVEY